MCGRKRRNTGSTARISALDAPMALNWLAAAQVALLLILTDNSAALCSYSANARDDGPAVLLDAYRALFATVFGKMEMAEARLPHNCRERRLPFLLCRHRRKDAEARAGDDVLVKLAIDAPLDLVRKVLKYV